MTLTSDFEHHDQIDFSLKYQQTLYNIYTMIYNHVLHMHFNTLKIFCKACKAMKISN